MNKYKVTQTESYRWAGVDKTYIVEELVRCGSLKAWMNKNIENLFTKIEI